MGIDWQKVFAIIVAGLCGITGFVITFWLLGWLFEPLLAHFKTKGAVK